ncbi:MAG TPA: transglutaminaseTgpA domain-containing protein, partial [Myxococcales bacterium]|nr:transglutaminaseTgpA domain-containing protein [Myxococcales bacterium]
MTAAPRLFARRGVTLLQAQRWAGTLTACCAFLSCAVSGELGPAMVVLFPLALAGALAWGDRCYGRGDWAWTTFIIGTFVVLAAEVVSGRLDVVLGAARFAELLLVHRLWHRRTQRDEALLLLLCLLLLCAGAALSAELAFGFAFLGFAVAATWAMALTHLRFEIEAGRGPSGSAALLQSRRIATPALLGALAALAVMGLVGAAIVFFAFPRVTIGGLRRHSKGVPAAGLGDNVDLSRHGVIGDDPRVVLRARLNPPVQRRTLDMHWRARSLEAWTGRGWRAAEQGMMLSTRMPRRDWQGKTRVMTADLEAVEGFSEGVVLTPEGWPFSVEFRRPMSARGSSQRLYRNAAGDLFYQPVEVGDLHYVVVVDRTEPGLDALRGRGMSYAGWLDLDRTAPGGLDPRIRALAERLGGGKDPADAAAAIERWLSTSLSYTRELPGEVADPVADFLFVRRKGHCELFSTAMVLMLRSLGIPARNVTGYYGGELTDAGYYAVRAGDAHSWVEVYFPGAGWSRFDPTPPGSRGSQQDSLWAHMVLLWDTLQERWRALVVDYDLISQGNAVRRMGELINEAGRRLGGKAGAAPRLRVIVLGLLIAAAAGLLAVALRRVSWRASFGMGGGRPAALEADRRRAMQLWRRAKQQMQRAGCEVR